VGGLAFNFARPMSWILLAWPLLVLAAAWFIVRLSESPPLP